MRLGGSSPFPVRLGGGASTTETVYRSLNDQLGTAYDTSQSSTVTAETMSEARAIAALWSANRRMSYQWDPSKMTDTLSRWERIFNIRPHRGASDQERRDRLVPRFLALTSPLYATLWDTCQSLLGAGLIGVEFISDADAHSQWAGSTPSMPSEWNSSLGHVVIRVHRWEDIGWTQYQLYSAIADCKAALNDSMPADITFDFAGFTAGGANGFYIDQRNLNWLTFV